MPRAANVRADSRVDGEAVVAGVGGGASAVVGEKGERPLTGPPGWRR